MGEPLQRKQVTEERKKTPENNSCGLGREGLFDGCGLSVADDGGQGLAVGWLRGVRQQRRDAVTPLVTPLDGWGLSAYR